MKIIYLAHPISGDAPRNIAEAKRWIRWLYDNVPGIAIVATWITECEVLDEANPEHRRLGLQRDVAVIGRCDAILLVGPKLSAGMQAELIAAEAKGLHVLNFVAYDRVPATVKLVRQRLIWCEGPKCLAPVTHMEHYYERRRGWCEKHVSWSGHHEWCPDPCTRLKAES